MICASIQKKFCIIQKKAVPLQRKIDKNMKVLLINGSPHKGGNTYLALKEAAQELERNGIETEIVSVGTKPVRGCIACATCKTKGNNQCVFSDDICNEVSAKMAQCDGLIVGSPVYYGQPNATVLALVQRMLYSNGAAFNDKPVAGVAVCRRGGATAALQTLNMPFQLLNMPIVTSQYWNIVYGRLEGEASLDAEGMQTMRSLAKNMAYTLRALEGRPKPEYEARQATHFIR